MKTGCSPARVRIAQGQGIFATASTDWPVAAQMPHEAAGSCGRFADADGSMLSLEVLRGRGRAQAELDERVDSVTPDAECRFYTSGTTGPPKACQLTHGTYRAITVCTGDAGHRALQCARIARKLRTRQRRSIGCRQATRHLRLSV
jgi:acyl-CoA synthetase (AMP-forming)/AMP-acid ligase II